MLYCNVVFVILFLITGIVFPESCTCSTPNPFWTNREDSEPVRVIYGFGGDSYYLRKYLALSWYGSS